MLVWVLILLGIILCCAPQRAVWQYISLAGNVKMVWSLVHKTLTIIIFLYRVVRTWYAAAVPGSGGLLSFSPIYLRLLGVRC